MIMKIPSVQSAMMKLNHIGNQNTMAFEPLATDVELIGQNHDYGPHG